VLGLKKIVVPYDKEKHLLCWDDEKLAVSHDEEKHLLCCLQFPTIKEAFIILG
jgi:hypothetical protein